MVIWHIDCELLTELTLNTQNLLFLTSSISILAERHKVYEAAKASHPERWNGRSTRDWSNITAVWLNPDKVCEETKPALDVKSQMHAS